jgi:PhoPQ-activated pathogenicity-related protein
VPRPLIALLAVVGLLPAAVGQAPAVPSDLTDYVARPEPDFAWKLVDKAESDGNAVYTLRLTSQRWHDELWEHDLLVFVPKGATRTDTPPAAGGGPAAGPAAAGTTVVLYNTGGTANAGNRVLGVEIARRVKAPVAILFGIPKQPLYGGKKEDALIAETFVRYLETGDGSWPLLFPMAKSVVKAMDAVQALAKQEWKSEVTGFVVTGASKRGWTSWLTAATGDKRVKAIAPMVIDTLNFQKQMPNQLASFGRYSEMIHDYEERKLLPLPDTTEARKLWAMVDPWVYRNRLTLPKMLIHGTNDPYWAQDATNVYWDDLKGEKHLLYVPNAGHGLTPEEQPNVKGTKKDPFPMKAIDTLAAFGRHVITGKPMANLTWKHTDAAGGPTLEVTTDVPAKDMRGWVTESDTRDFRRSKWTPVASHGNPTTAATMTVARSGKFQALFGEAEYEIDGLRYSLSTQIRILEPKK